MDKEKIVGPEDVEEIYKIAELLHSKSKRQIKGQTVTMYDSFVYHVICATLEYYDNKVWRT